MQFYEKLDFLMNITKTSNSALGQKVNLDASYVSRLRKGQRSALKDITCIKSMCHTAGTRLTNDQLLEMCINAWPIIIFQKQLKDNSRKIMEIFEARGLLDGAVKGKTLYRYEVDRVERDSHGHIIKVHGKHRRTGCISPALYNSLRDNGAPDELLKRLFPEFQAEERK